MARRFALISIVIALLFSLTGCYKLDAKLKINAEGLVTGTAIVAVPKTVDPKIRKKIFADFHLDTTDATIKVEDWSGTEQIGKKYIFTNTAFTNVFPEDYNASWAAYENGYILRVNDVIGYKDERLPVLKIAKNGNVKPKTLKVTPTWTLRITMPTAITSASSGVKILKAKDSDKNGVQAVIPGTFFTDARPIEIIAGEIPRGVYEEGFAPRDATPPPPPQAPAPPSNLPVTFSWLLILGGAGLAIFGRKVDWVSLKKKKENKTKNAKKSKGKKK